MSSTWRFVTDFGPLVLFFLTYRFAGVFAATLALMLATAAALLATYIVEKKLAVLPLVSGLAIAVLGSLTLLLKDELFIKIKPTLVNLFFAALLLGGLAFKKALLKYVLSHAFHLTERGWRILTLRWGVFFLFLACLNEYIWRTYPTDFWVNFKVFGVFVLSIFFTACQIPLVKREWVEKVEG